jgi:hypothetical protein
MSYVKIHPIIREDSEMSNEREVASIFAANAPCSFSIDGRVNLEGEATGGPRAIFGSMNQPPPIQRVLCSLKST